MGAVTTRVSSFGRVNTTFYSLLKFLNEKDGENLEVCDFGCLDGLHTIPFLKKGYLVDAFDMNEIYLYGGHIQMPIIYEDGQVVLQRMIPADFAGVMFTKNPVSNNKDCIIIEACKGVASKLVDNKVVPDRYFINQDNLEITASTKTLNNIPEEIIKKLASIGKDLEQKYGCDVDIEWACENNIIYIIQCRPITT